MLCVDNTLLLLYLMSLQKIVQATYYSVLNYLSPVGNNLLVFGTNFADPNLSRQPHKFSVMW
jgi:hypothetical protein